MGRRVKMKGLADALTALNIIAEKDINFRVRIFTRESLILEKCNFPVEIVSPPDDEPLVKDLCECGLFLAASWFEGFYLPGLEAMACGLPVVTTDNGGCREYALDGKNCLMVPPRQPEKLAKAVIKILNNPGLAEKLSHRGLQTAQKFDWEKIVDVMESQFERDLATI
jgi:glycosyltransferase involved in cell wall biosynthesis